ncbi:hypothetical protein [Treponema sp.]|uniref:hypothetical protein n=1 Tax=Treponema sp. TaxID=166 RepID=UPI0025F0429E|nr:hypothetical protein [Treponema sp.]
MTAVLFLLSTAVPLRAAGFSAGISAGAISFNSDALDSNIIDDRVDLFSAGINFKKETIPLCFFADCLLDFSKDGSDILSAAEFSFDYYIASPVFSGTYLHYFYGPEFAAGFYGTYFADAGFCGGLSCFTSYNVEVFIKASVRAGLEFTNCNPSLNLAIPVKGGIKYYF